MSRQDLSKAPRRLRCSMRGSGHPGHNGFLAGMEVQMIVTKSGQELADVIKKAIEDSVITFAEFEEITSVASKDGILDNHEKALLKQLNALIANKTVKLGKSP